MVVLSQRNSEGTRWLMKACQLLKENRWPTGMQLSFDGLDFEVETRNECALVLFDAISGWGDAVNIRLKNISFSLKLEEKFESVLHTNLSLEKLSLVKISCEDDGLDFLARSKRIKELTIDGCLIRSQNYFSLRRLLKLGTLQVLNLYNLDLDDMMPIILPSILKSTSLTILQIRSCRMSQETLVELLQRLKLGKSLQSLVLHNCGIGSSVKKELDDMILENSTLRSLDLGDNNICRETIALLVNSGLKHNKSLRTLILSQNPIGDDGACSIAHLLVSNPTIESLSLIDCEIWGRGCQSLASDLALMKGLKEFFVNGDMEDYAHIVLKSLESNMTLHHLWTEQAAYLAHEDNTWREVEFFLRLNRCKRRILVEPKVPVSIWPLVLEGISGDPRLIYHLLRQKPELIETTLN